jgi:hypothetical protein
MKGDEAGPTGSATNCFALPFSFTEVKSSGLLWRPTEVEDA